MKRHFDLVTDKSCALKKRKEERREGGGGWEEGRWRRRKTWTSPGRVLVFNAKPNGGVKRYFDLVSDKTSRRRGRGERRRGGGGGGRDGGG